MYCFIVIYLFPALTPEHTGGSGKKRNGFGQTTRSKTNDFGKKDQEAQNAEE